MSQAIATFGGGCFWCTEAIFNALKGVDKVISGYSGGTAETADYKTVCSGRTEHAEVVQIHYDSDQISYPELLEVFFATHDPTTLNRQGNDRGPQYRSVVFYHDETQKNLAQSAINGIASELYDDPVVTTLEPFETFYEAEAYHQNYFAKTGDQNPYCTMVISPKVNKLRQTFAHKLK